MPLQYAISNKTQGNIRLSYTWDARNHCVETLQENHYYPFGLRHHAYSPFIRTIRIRQANEKEIRQIPAEAVVYKYKYQGQERQDELGLNWDSFKYRNYDYAIGRFMSIDPLAEKYPNNSTYAFSENRVVDNVELEGMEGVDFRMKMIEATHAEETGLMSAQEYLHGTQPIFIIPSTSYMPNRDTNGNVVIDNNWQAIRHYYRGNGESVSLGSKTIELIKSSKDVQH